MIVTKHIIDMINDWLGTPPNAYFGSDYGCDINSLFLKPLGSIVANNFIDKMRKDLPILNMLNNDQLSLYTQPEGFETTIIFLQIGDVAINLNDVNDQRQTQQTGETFNVLAG